MDIDAVNRTIISCRKCPRLVEYRESVAKKKKRAYREAEYWGKPVPAFGDINGRIMVVGLAPGPHGSNRTGRMFTGDASGVFLFSALYHAGFANQAVSRSTDDGLELNDMLISAVCRCVPPDNKPSPGEISNCLPYLEQEISLMANLQGFVALGRLAFQSIQRLYRGKRVSLPKFEFRHAGVYQPDDSFPWVVASYHPSQQNTQTGRLTVVMFDEVWQQAKALLA